MSDLSPMCAPKRTPPTATDLWVHTLSGMTLESTRRRGAPQRLRRVAEGVDKGRRALHHEMFAKTRGVGGGLPPRPRNASNFRVNGL